MTDIKTMAGSMDMTEAERDKELGIMEDESAATAHTETPKKTDNRLYDNNGDEVVVRRHRDMQTGELRYSITHKRLNKPLEFSGRRKFKDSALDVLREHDIDVDKRNFRKWYEASHKDARLREEMTDNMHTSLGWDVVNGEPAVCLDDVYTVNGPQHSVYHGSMEELIGRNGSLAAYLNGLRDLVVPYPKISVMFLAGLSGLFTQRFRESDMNVLLNLYGTTSKGKTITLETALSAWGNPDSLKETWDSTRCGHDDALRNRSLLPFSIDDALLAYKSMSDDKCSSELRVQIFALAGGVTRARHKEPPVRFYCPTLMTTEESMMSKMKGGGVRGQENRLIEVKVDNDLTTDGRHAAELKRLTHENYGLFAPALAQWMVSSGPDEQAMRARIERIHENLMQDERMDGSYERLAKRISVILLMGELSNECFGELEFPLDAIRDILLGSVVASKEQCETTDICYSSLCRLYSEHPELFADNITEERQNWLGRCLLNLCKITYSFRQMYYNNVYRRCLF